MLARDLALRLVAGTGLSDAPEPLAIRRPDPGVAMATGGDGAGRGAPRALSPPPLPQPAARPPEIAVRISGRFSSSPRVPIVPMPFRSVECNFSWRDLWSWSSVSSILSLILNGLVFTSLCNVVMVKVFLSRYCI